MENNMIDLMTPRYEVIAPVPFSKFMVGDILHQHRHKVFGVDYTWFSADRYSQCINAKEIFDYPRLFRPLAWYEKRDIKDMPEYVKKSFSKEVIRIDEISNLELMISKGFVMDEDTADIIAFSPVFFNNYIPATATEYDNYIKQKI